LPKGVVPAYAGCEPPDLLTRTVVLLFIASYVREKTVHFDCTRSSNKIQGGGDLMERPERPRTQRIDLRFPENLLRQVEEYQHQNGLLTRTAAILELIRRGLEAEKSKNRD